MDLHDEFEEEEETSSSLNGSSSYNSLDSTNESPLVSFGLITDIQYADHDDLWNYNKTALRRYRNALKLTDEACRYWSNAKFPISFILQLGDIIDGLSSQNGQSQTALDTILKTFRTTFPNLPMYNCWGNHELYNFSRSQLLNGPLRSFHSKDIEPAHYGIIDVCPQLRILAIDTYDFSALGVDETSDVYIKSMELLRKYNKNESPNDPTGLRGHQRRFVQFNGGVSDKQLEWIKQELNRAKTEDMKIILIGHVPIHPSACDHLDLLWNYKELLDLLWTFDGTVIAYLAGHDHPGGYFRDRKNIHHLTVHAVIESDTNTNSFATVHVYKNFLLIEGVGLVESYKIDF